MATAFTGFTAPHKNTLQVDLREAQTLCVQAANSLLINQDGDANRRSRELLLLTFRLAGSGDDFWDKVAPIKNTFLGFQGRIERLTLLHEKSKPTGNPKEVEFVAFTKPSSDPNTIFVRDVYFQKPPAERALTLIHEYVHLRNPMNPGDGHPGGVVLIFDDEASDVGVDYSNAIKNPYCYQYYAQWLK